MHVVPRRTTSCRRPSSCWTRAGVRDEGKMRR
jgi:hypothetical protein